MEETIDAADVEECTIRLHAADGAFADLADGERVSPAELARLRDAGVQLIDQTPRIGIRGSRVAFCHPKSTGGVLTEIVEPAEGH